MTRLIYFCFTSFSMWALLLGVVLIFGITSASELQFKRFLNLGQLTTAQKSQIQVGFNDASYIADKIHNKDLSGIAGALTGKVNTYLSALGPFVGITLSSFGGQSAAEVTLLKHMFTNIQNRFDQNDVQLSQLLRQKNFPATHISFAQIEANINAVQHKFSTLSRATSLSAYKFEANDFQHTYERIYDSSGVKLLNGITHGANGGLFNEFMTFSHYDRTATTSFMVGTLNLLIRAAALEMTYAEIRNDSQHAARKQQWVSRFAVVKNKMLAVDNAITHHH